jgi:hypothetical protein
MNKLRGTLLAALIGSASAILPANKCEAGLIDWLRCVLHPCRSCEPSCDVPSCPPVVQEGSYCNPCAQPAPCAPAPVSYVRRTYMEPRTRMESQSVVEPTPTYVRRRYWDPCSRCYKTYFESATSYVKRRYCVPVTDYVERSYLEPVSCVTPACPSGSCPTGLEPMPAAAPAATLDRPGQQVVGGTSQKIVPSRLPTSRIGPSRRTAPYLSAPGA